MDDRELYYPSDRKHFWKMLRSEILMRRFNRTPLWMVKTRNRIFIRWIGNWKRQQLVKFKRIEMYVQWNTPSLT